MFAVSLKENLERFQSDFDGSIDFIVRRLRIDGIDAAFLSMEGMVNKQIAAQSILTPLMNAEYPKGSPQEKFDYLKNCVLSAVDQKEPADYSQALSLLMSGFALLLLDGCPEVLAIGIQGFSFRSIGDPQNESMQRGSREGFVEPLQINMTMLRRRMKTTKLKFEQFTAGKESGTMLCLCYLRDRVSPELLRAVRRQLKEAQLDAVLAAGYVSPFLRGKGSLSLFSTVGLSERPDTVCGKIEEGRVAILIDGTPNVIVLPHLFLENFQSLDDYANRPFYAAFTRVLKLLAFFLAMYLPGFYVAASTFHPEMIPEPLLLKIAQSELNTPFSVMVEAIVIHIIYEIMREAGLRAPKSLGHAVSIVGALVIGDAAVNSGLVGAPTLMVIAVTAISSYLVPSLYEPVALCRLVFILIGGTIGFWGLMTAMFLMTANLCSESSFGIPFGAPLSPFSLSSMRDAVLRFGWPKLGKRVEKIQDLPGSTLDP